MSLNQTKQEGGLVLKRKELECLLEEPNTIGLAFAVNKPGNASNVDLKVLRVYKNGEGLVGEQRSCRTRKGAGSALQYPQQSKTDFKFKYLDKLQRDNFYFGFYPKEKFKLLFKGKWDEIYIGGGEVDYGEPDFLEKDQTEWFTFTISLRKKLKKRFLPKNTKVEEFIAAKWPNKRLINIGDFKSKEIIPLEELERFCSAHILENHSVNTMIVDKTNKLIKGLMLKSGRLLYPMVFSEDSKVSSIVLRPDESLRLLINGKDNDSKDSVEEFLLGGYPGTDHMRGCPPQWDYTRSRNIDATILEALS